MVMAHRARKTGIEIGWPDDGGFVALVCGGHVVTRLREPKRELPSQNYRDRTLSTPLSSAATLPCVSRIARSVVAGPPHHVTRRGKHRAAMFFAAGGDAL